MKILIGHNHYQEFGGEDVVAQAEVDLLRSRGEDVILFERHNDEINQLSLPARLSLFASLGYSRKAYRDFRAVLRQHRPHAAHFHNIYYMMTPAVYQACRDEGVAVVQSLHNYRMFCANAVLFRDGHVCEDCLQQGSWPGVRNRCFKGSALKTLAMSRMIERGRRERTWLTQVDRYIAAADFTRQKFIQNGIPSEKIVLKPHFVHPDPKARNVDKGYALYLGRLSQEKGVEVLMDAWKSLGQIPLKVVGSGPLRESLSARVRAMGQPQIEFAGFVSQTQAQEYLREARFVVIPSVCYENFPRVVVEAFALGVPVVASRLGSLAELVAHDRTGRLFEAGNSRELAEQVRWCFDHPHEVADMGRRARHDFEQKYTAGANYPQLMAVYDQAIEAMKGEHG